MRLSAALIALLVGSVSARAQSSSASELCGQAGKIASELATISGLKLRHAVPCDFITKEKVNEFLGGALDVAKMAAVIDPNLYRNRKGPI